MSEIERAIECFKKKVWSGELYEAEVDMYNAVIKLLRAELSRQENAPLTWNERINQMTVEEKADVAVIISKRCSTALEKESCPDLTCWQCFIEFLNSPYTEGESK